LVFTSSNKQYIVDTSFRYPYPALQRQQDDFLVDPRDGSGDPMEDYRRALSSDELFVNDGLRGIGRLGAEPVTLDLYFERLCAVFKARPVRFDA
jgi:hypothetical protein